MHMCHVCAWYLRRPEEGIRPPRTVVTGDPELPHGCWEGSPDLLQDQLVLLNYRTLSPARLFFEAGSHYVVLVVLELVIYFRIASNSVHSQGCP